MRLLLARHGETPWNAEGRYQGQEDIALSSTGEAQARMVVEQNPAQVKAYLPLAAAAFVAGSVPGMPRQTGLTCVFGSAPNFVETRENSFPRVASCTWTSRPMTTS